MHQVNPTIVKLIEESSADNDGTQILRIYNDIKNEGKKDNLWYTRKIPVSKMGAHRDNRGGLMVGGQDALSVLDTIDAVGYDSSCHADATAFEEGPQRLNEKKFVPLTESDDMLKTYKLGDIDAASVACTHFTQAISAAEARVAWDNQNITEGGCLSQEKLICRHPEMSGLFGEHGGITYTVWKASAEEMYPGLPDLAQRALNAKYAAQQQERWPIAYQRAVKVLNSEAAKKSLNPVSYTIRDILKSRPKCSKEVPLIVDVAKLFGGSSTHTFVDPLMSFVRTYGKNEVDVPAAIWKAIANLKLQPHEWSPHFINSILFYVAAQKGLGKASKPISAGDVSSLEKGEKLVNMQKCENIIKTAIELTVKMGLALKHCTACVGNLRLSLVMKVLEKSEHLENTTFDKLAYDFFVKAIKEKTTDAEITSPWNIDEPTTVEEPTSRGATTSMSSVVSFNEYGEACGLHEASLRNRGFIVNGFVKNKKGSLAHD